MKRISITIDEAQHEQIQNLGINLSGLIRDLVADHLSEDKITLAVSPEAKAIYDKVVSNTGATDEDLEPYIIRGLKSYLEEKIKSIKDLERDLKDF